VLADLRPPPLRRMAVSIMHDSLYRNSSFLVMNSVVTAALGFVFWAIASRLLPASAVGNVFVVVGAISFAGAAGALGLPNTVIRFLAAERDPVRFLRAAGVVVAGAGAAVGAAWYAVPRHFGVPLSIIGPAWIGLPMIAATVAIGALAAVAQAAIVAMRRCQWVIVENTAGSLAKLALLPFVVGLGATGLFGLYFLGLVVSTVVSIGILVRMLGSTGSSWRSRVELRALAGRTTYAAGTHVGALVAMLPTAGLPILVLERLGARQAAYFAMPLMIVALLNVIPSMASQSLFAEASADEDSLPAHVRRTVAGVYTVMIPAIVVLCVLARPILSVFGPGYAANGTACLQLLALSGLFASFNYVADAILVATKHVREYVFLNTTGTMCALGLPLAFMGRGLTGVGIGWLLGQLGYAMLAVGTLVFVRTRRPAFRAVAP